MWKKLLTVFISLIGVFSIAYGVNQNLQAMVNDPYESKPFNMNYKAGVYWGEFKGTPIEWYVIANDFEGRNASPTELTLFSRKVLEYGPYASSGTAQYGNSLAYNWTITNFNATTFADEAPYILPQYVLDANGTMSSITTTTDFDKGNFAYLLSASDFTHQVYHNPNAGGIRYEPNFKYFLENIERISDDLQGFWGRSEVLASGNQAFIVYSISDGEISGTENITLSDKLVYGINFKLGYRPAMQLDQSKIALATSLSDATGINTTSQGYATLAQITNDDKMKIALKDESIRLNITSIDKQILKGRPLSLEFHVASATPNDSAYVNAVITTKRNNEEVVVYAGRIAHMNDVQAQIDMSNLAEGTYTFRFYYEEVKQGLTNYNIASAISKPYEVEVLKPLSFSYQKNAGTLTYGENSTQNEQKIGTIIPSNGVLPHTFEVQPSSDDSTGYNHFKIASSANEDGTWDVLIDDIDGLSAGTYNFMIIGQDANGDPIDAGGNPTATTKVTVVVEKATPVISFIDPTIRNVPYVSGYTFTENITHDNTDDNATISYRSNNGIVNVIKEPTSDHANITLNTTNNTGNAIITATLAETANFKQATANKTINVYNGINNLRLEYAKTPITALDTMNANYLIGKLRFDGGVGNFTVEIADEPGDGAANADGSKFSVDTTATSSRMMDVYTTQPLHTGSYRVTFKITDSFKHAKYLKTTMVVAAGEVTGFEFYEDATMQTIKTNQTLKIPYGTRNTQLYAGGGTGTGAISYRVKTGEPQDIIQIQNPTTGTYTILKTGSVKVEAIKAADANYATKVIEMIVQIEAQQQSISFPSTLPAQKKFVLDDTIDVTAHITRPDGSSGVLNYRALPASVCIIENASVPILKMKGKGNCTVYAENRDANYQAAVQTKTINLYEGITGTFVQVVDPLRQGDALAKAGSTTAIAKVSNLNGGDGTFNFTGLKAYRDGVDVSSIFQMDTNGNITPKQDIPYGEYEMQITIEDGNQEATTINATLTVDLEINTGFQLTKDGKVEASIESDYVSAQNPKISVDTIGKKGTNPVQYKLVSQRDASQSTEAISIDPQKGILNVHRAMSSNDRYRVYAIIEEDLTNGYAKQETQQVDIIIHPSPQHIRFHESVLTSVKFDVGKTFAINASIDRPDGVITYSSATTSICTVDDPMVPIATVVGKGNCIIRAENNDDNYMPEMQAKSIAITDGMSAVFQQTIQPLRQGDAALQPSSDTIIAKITSLFGNQGSVNYSLSVKKGIVDVSHLFVINENGEIRVADRVTHGTYDVVATLRDQTGADGEVMISGQLLVGLEENTAFSLTYKGVEVTSITEDYTTAIKGMSVSVSGQKGSGKVTYTKTSDSDTNAIEIQSDGTLIVHGVMQPHEVFKVYAYVEEDVLHGYARQETAPVSIRISEASMGVLGWQIDGVDASELHATYAQGKTFRLGVSGLPENSSVRYFLQADSDGEVDGIFVEDVVSVDEDTGEVRLLHASLDEQIGIVKIQAEVSCNGYVTTLLDPLDVFIDKAEQTNFKFSQNTYIMPNGTGSFSPTFIGGAVHADGSSYNQKLSCPDPYDVRVDPLYPDTFQYNVTDVEGATITIKARNLGNRDYHAKEATAILKILKAGESLFDVDVSPSKVIAYGDTVTLLPDVAQSATISYTYTSEDTALLQQDATDPNVFHGKNVGTASIRVTKHELGKADAEAIVNIRIQPKDVVVELQGTYQIKTGEDIPAFVLAPYPAGTILAGDTLPPPTITTTAQDTWTQGVYPITVTYAKDAISDKYHFIQTPIDLIITQDQPEADWFKAYAKSDSSKTQLPKTIWLNEPIILESLHPTYNTISKNGKNNWAQTLEISQEGEYEVPLYFQSSATNALSAPIQTTVRIDRTGPVITSIEARNTNTSTFARAMNAISFQAFYKPQVEVTIQAEDIPIAGTSGSSGVKAVAYRIDTLKNGQVDQNIKLEPGGNTSDRVTITLSKVGEYRICATAIDQVGNSGSETCKDINVKKIDVLVDEDDLPDFNDTNEDGCPDVNIKWRNPQNPQEWIIRNGDRDYDGLPDVNIDANGDGEVDLNIDTDNDGSPDINLIDMTKKDEQGKKISWEPTVCVTSQLETYCTGTDAQATINVDIDGDGIPELNIDTDGDMIADFNISFDNEKPYLNIGKVPSVWKPTKDAMVDRFRYDTMDNLIPVLNMGIIEHRYPSMNIDIDGDGVAELNIDLDRDGIPELNIDGTGEGKATINIDHDGDGKADDYIMNIDTWKPEILVEHTVSYMTMKLSYKGIEQLEDQGIIVTDTDKGFLPNFALKVSDVTKQKQEELKKTLQEQGKEGSIAVIYEVHLYQDETIVQPDGSIQVKVPIASGVGKPNLMMQQKDGSFSYLRTEIIDGYYVFETDYLGVLMIIDEEVPKQGKPTVDQDQSDTSVKGNYQPQGNMNTSGGIGGAYTGDPTHMFGYAGSICLSAFILLCLYRKNKSKQTNKKR